MDMENDEHSEKIDALTLALQRRYGIGIVKTESVQARAFRIQ